MKNYAINNDVLTIWGTEKDISGLDFGPMNYAFIENKDALRKLIIEEGVCRMIGKGNDGGHFSGYANLREVVLPESLQYIGSGAFRDCKNLTEVTLLDSLEYLDHAAFKNTPWRENNIEEEKGCFYLGRFLIDSDKDIVTADIREGTIMICGWAFKGREKLTHVNISETVRIIGEQAFKGCTNLTELCISGNSLKQIEALAFTDCSNLKTIAIPDSCMDIDKSAFVSSRGKNIYFPQNAYIPNIHLDNCEAIQKEFYAWCYITSAQRYSADEREMYDAYIRKYKMTFLPKLINQQNIKALQEHAQNLLTKKNIDEIIEFAVQRKCAEATAFLMDWKKSNVKESKKKDPLMVELEKNPFSAAELKKIWSTKKLPDGTLCTTTYKGTEKDVVVPAQIGKTAVSCIGKDTFSAFIFVHGMKDNPKERIEANKKIKSVTISEGIKKIEDGAFNWCESLVRVVIPASVCEIDTLVFSSRNSRKKLTIHAPAGSYAERYAKENGIRFSALKE